MTKRIKGKHPENAHPDKVGAKIDKIIDKPKHYE